MSKSISYYKRKCDNIFSLYIRRVGKCEWCGSINGQLQCAHVVGRANHALRWDPMNAVCLDARCHRFAHDNPLEFAKWFQETFPNRYLYLCDNRNRIVKRKLVDYQELLEVLKKL